MEITISSKTKKLIEEASKELNLDSETTITIAIESYLENRIDSDLKKELEGWEELGIEALENFEKSL
ncbi:MAG: hypothetical protein AABX48_00945 [Nanoarchaeota archaeon]